MVRLSEHALINIKNKSHSVTAEIMVPESGAKGTIIAQGGNFGGWVHIEVGDDSHDHYIDEEDRMRIAMSLQ
jgi:hypothetical protein